MLACGGIWDILTAERRIQKQGGTSCSEQIQRCPQLFSVCDKASKYDVSVNAWLADCLGSPSMLDDASMQFAHMSTQGGVRYLPMMNQMISHYYKNPLRQY